MWEAGTYYGCKQYMSKIWKVLLDKHCAGFMCLICLGVPSLVIQTERSQRTDGTQAEQLQLKHEYRLAEHIDGAFDI